MNDYIITYRPNSPPPSCKRFTLTAPDPITALNMAWDALRWRFSFSPQAIEGKLHIESENPHRPTDAR